MDKSFWVETTTAIYTCGWQDTPWWYMGSGNYIIVYSDEVNHHQYSGEYTDTVPATEGSPFPLRYNPEKPEENDMTVAVKRQRWLTIVGSAVIAAVMALYWWHGDWK